MREACPGPSGAAISQVTIVVISSDEELTGAKRPREQSEKSAAISEAERREDAGKMKAFFSKDEQVTREYK